MPYPTKFNGEQAVEIARRYSAGESASKMAAEFGCNAATVLTAVRNNGVEVRPPPRLALRPTPEQEAEILALFDAGLQQQDIVDRVPFQRATIRRIIAAAGRNPKQNGNYARSGERHGMWKGGRVLNAEGYVWVRPTEDELPLAGKVNNGYVAEHRLVMAKQIGRPLRSVETVHHINGDKTDNRPENLQLRQGKHGTGTVNVCLDCGSHNLGHVPIADPPVPSPG